MFSVRHSVSGFARAVLPAISGLLISGLVATGAALAQDYSLCVKLEARLVDLERGSMGASPVTIQRYNSDIIEQQRMLNVARRQAARAGCDQQKGFLFFRPQRPAGCGDHDAIINRLETNLQRLQGQRRNLMPVDTGVNEGERRRLLAMLGDNRCGPQYERYATRRSGGMFDFFNRDYTRDPYVRDPYMMEPSGGMGFYGTYRTLCVRTCDGFFWPISFSTVQGRFDMDAQMCQASCPTSDVALYVHRNPGEGPEEAISLFGEPISRLPNAFRFRNEFVNDCSCKAGMQTAALGERVVVALPGRDGSMILSDTGARRGVVAEKLKPLPTAAMPIPVPRNRPGNEPPVAGSIATVTGMEDYIAVSAPKVGVVAGKSVRIVGPGFTLYRSGGE
ncbi:DUF2865 domain-containing protein [Microbaculum sp. FT89]|uniref:DUF2865 domain-containing protein n=1 Tax=Microbaculum sp. FT89 TaxID=3447298 RepID=UPI003F53B97A